MPDNGSGPQPDPTALIKVAVDEAKADLRRERQLLLERVEARIMCLEELILEKFKSVDLRFAERDMRFNAAADVAKMQEQALDVRINDMRDHSVPELRDRIKAVEAKTASNVLMIGWLILGASLIVAIAGLFYTKWFTGH
jgi:hypothetical protein